MADQEIKPERGLPVATRFKLGVLALAQKVYTRADGTVKYHRLSGLLDIKTSAPATRLVDQTRVSTSDVQIDPARSLWFRLFTPSANGPDRPLPLIVYFHGGGFTSYGPDSKTFDNLCRHLAAKVPAVVASVNYRLAPDFKYPSQYEDGFDAVRFMDEQNGAVLPACTDLRKCFIGGDSAGGNISHNVTVRVLNNAKQFSQIRVIGVLSLQPFFGGEDRTESELRLTRAPMLNVKRTDVMWRNFLPEGADRNHPAAHVFGGGEELKNLDFPGILVIVGGNDPLQDWDRRYVEWLKDCGKAVEVTEYPNAFHGFYGFPEMPEFALLIDRVRDFVQKQAHSN